VLIVESKDRAAAANDQDIFRIVASELVDESKMRSCAELGYKA